MRIRLGDLARVLVSVAAEVALLIVLWKATAVLGSIDFSHLGAWMRDTDPTTAVLASVFHANGVWRVWGCGPGDSVPAVWARVSDVELGRARSELWAGGRVPDGVDSGATLGWWRFRRTRRAAG